MKNTLTCDDLEGRAHAPGPEFSSTIASDDMGLLSDIAH